jgi:uncharacterized protein YehS (DUF1456 family)
MTPNDVLRSIRYMLDLSDVQVVKIAQLVNPEISLDTDTIKAMQKREGEAGYEACSDQLLLDFLDGLIVHRRGTREDAPAVGSENGARSRANNNLILKKLRVAFELKDLDLQQIFNDAGFPLSKAELSALFRQPEHRNFRACGDQILRNFLKGLTMGFRD